MGADGGIPEESTDSIDFLEIRRRCELEPEWLEAEDEFGDTPLLRAVGNQNLDLIRCLLDLGANVNAQGGDGNTALTISIDDESSESEVIIRLLLSYGADVNQFGFSGATPLHTAAARGDSAAARLLIDAGADVNRRKEIDAQETPLMEAAYCGRPETLQLLLDNGADSSLRDVFHHETALEMAIKVMQGPDPDVRKHLEGEVLSVDVDELFSEMELSGEELEQMKQSMEGVNLADQYEQSSRELTEKGNHSEVIRILSERQLRS